MDGTMGGVKGGMPWLPDDFNSLLRFCLCLWRTCSSVAGTGMNTNDFWYTSDDKKEAQSSPASCPGAQDGEGVGKEVPQGSGALTLYRRSPD